MAGRPRSMAKRVALLEEAAYQLYRDLCKVRPKQYAALQYDNLETQGELCSYWNGTVKAVEDAWDCLQLLLELLEQRAGLSYRFLYLQRAKSRGLLKESLAHSIEKSVGSESLENTGEG